MQLQGLQEWISSLENSAAQFVGKTESYIIGKLVAFRDKRGELSYNLRKLTANPPPANAPAALKADYAATLAAAQDAKSKADWLGPIADQFTAITGLGALPAIIAGIPVAVLIAGAVALTVIITNVSGMIGRYLGARQIVASAAAQNKDATGALQSYYASASTGFFGDASQLVWPLAIVAGAYVFLSRKK